MKYMLGCNYWASNTGVYMWRNFDETVIDRDFALLEKHGVNTVRIFPLWSDFQPVSEIYDLDKTFSARTGDVPLKTHAGLDEKMLARFSKVLDLADKYGFQVVVGLITGWMSGRLFYPEILYNENPLTSPKAIVWETKFITEFVTCFKDRKCIVAWEPGNECNCLADTITPVPTVVSAEQAELWLSSICHAIRAADSTRPIWSGMHGLKIEGSWDMRTVAEYTDMQTTHPYPLFTPYCAIESLPTFRAALHAAAESAYYAGLADQPCLVEEIGTLGPNVLSDDGTPKYLEQSLFTSYQYGTTGYLWWCAFDQDGLEFPPYDGSALERNLGLAKFDGTPKPVLREMKKMSRVLSEIGSLPANEKHAVVLLTNGQSAWRSAYGAFCLAAQAGYSVEFMYRSQPLKESDVYILPCVDGDVYLKFLPELLERIKKGAKLFISYDGGHLPRFEELTGLRVYGRESANKRKQFTFNGKGLSLDCTKELNLKAVEAHVLLEVDGNVLLSENRLGKGSVFFLNAPLERYYTEGYKPYETGLHEFYAYLLKDVERPLTLNNDRCTVTYHRLDEGTVVALIYRFGEEKEIPYYVGEGYELKNCRYGKTENGKIVFRENFVCVEIEKKD